MKVFLFSIVLLISGLSIAQSDTRFHMGIGLSNDVSSYYSADYANYLLNKESKFNLGAQLGGYYYNFDNNNLSKDSKLYGSLAFSLRYQITEKFTLQVDSGTKIPLGKPEVAFIDSMNNKIPDSEIGVHAFTMPLLTYDWNDDFGIFLGYHFVFEDRLDMNTLSLGLRFSLSGD
ncbi:MAG: hypothetical protein QMB11_02280 [Nonlabens sp.]|jgi:hypothetical protein|uniref:hypothetical protein n=1 Tax=Nonlabens sp. TaxID=1888209 RepID=UPI0035A63D2D